MTEETREQLLNIEELEQVENTFLDDDEDDPDCGSSENLYSHYRFPDEEPTTVRFKGKKSIFVKAVVTLKDLLKKGEGSDVNNVSFKVLDVRKMQHGVEYDIQCIKNQEKGVSVLKLYGPNPKKGCTVMICKSREHENKFVSILSKDVIKHLLDVFEATDGWKSFLKFSVYKKPSCTKCKKSFCNDKNLMTHIKKYHSETTALRCDLCDIVCAKETELKAHNESNHTNNKIIQCELCKITFETEHFLKTHIIKKHPRDTDIKCEKCDYTVDIDNERFMLDHTQQAHQNLDLQEEDDNEMEIDDRNEKREDNENKVKILEDCIKRMEKEDLRKSNEIKRLKEENKTILEKLGQLQWNKDKMDAELKAKEKTEKIKRNMKLFNDIVGQKEVIKEKNDVENEMEVVECDEISELYTLQQNKKNGSMRTSPQESSEVRRRIENCEKKVINCPQCDFKTPSERFFNEHM